MIDDGARSFEWDPLNRLTAINYLPLGGWRTEFTYKGLSGNNHFIYGASLGLMV